MRDTGWSDYGPGVRVRRLGEESGAGVYLLKMDPGARIPRDSHPSRETMVILEGGIVVHLWTSLGKRSEVHTPGSGPASALADIECGVDHEVVAHPLDGALLLSVARPDWTAA